MMLAQLIQKGGLQRLAAATVATPARLPLRSPQQTVASVATVAVANATQHSAGSIREWWQERAAIMIFDAGLAEALADTEAWQRTLIHFHLPANYRLH